jgi:lipoate-protein ligase A
MNKHRIIRLHQTTVKRVFAKETQCIADMHSGEIEQCLLLWQTAEPTLVLPGSNKWQQTEALTTRLQQQGWQIISRRTGGAPVPQTQGVINVSHLYLWPKSRKYSITLAYQDLCRVLSNFFLGFGIKTDIHATPGSYCDGDYNLNINQKKVVGTAQRVILKQGGDKIILAQACLLINVDISKLLVPVHSCYELNHSQERFRADVHSSLFEHIQLRPTIDQLYQKISQAFINYSSTTKQI